VTSASLTPGGPQIAHGARQLHFRGGIDGEFSLALRPVAEPAHRLETKAKKSSKKMWLDVQICTRGKVKCGNPGIK